jgi:hypothetical protein
MPTLHALHAPATPGRGAGAGAPGRGTPAAPGPPTPPAAAAGGRSRPSTVSRSGARMRFHSGKAVKGATTLPLGSTSSTTVAESSSVSPSSAAGGSSTPTRRSRPSPGGVWVGTRPDRRSAAPRTAGAEAATPTSVRVTWARVSPVPCRASGWVAGGGTEPAAAGPADRTGDCSGSRDCGWGEGGGAAGGGEVGMDGGKEQCNAYSME